MGGFFYMNFLKKTFQSFEDIIKKELDSVQKVIKTPGEAVYNNCKYPIENQTDNFLSGIPEYSSYSWDNETKTAIITLSKNENLTVKRGGCDQFDFYITLQKNNSLINLNNKEEAIKDLLNHAEKLFEAEDYSRFLTALQNGDYKIDKYSDELRMVFNINDFCFSEIYMYNNKVKNISMIKIGYTKC